MFLALKSNICRNFIGHSNFWRKWTIGSRILDHVLILSFQDDDNFLSLLLFRLLRNTKGSLSSDLEEFCLGKPKDQVSLPVNFAYDISDNEGQKKRGQRQQGATISAAERNLVICFGSGFGPHHTVK